MARDINDTYDFAFKIIAIGDTGVGKTSILERFNTDTYQRFRKSTIGVDFHTKTIVVDDKRIKLVFWDTAGAERFNSITNTCYRSTQGVLLVYDITNRASFLNAWKWIKEVRLWADPNVRIMVVGNKCDLEEARAVELAEAKDLCEYIPEISDVIETSAKQNINVDSAFLGLAKELKRQYDSGALQIGLEDSIHLGVTEEGSDCTSYCSMT